jgi:hypothetical protein
MRRSIYHEIRGNVSEIGVFYRIDSCWNYPLATGTRPSRGGVSPMRLPWFVLAAVSLMAFITVKLRSKKPAVDLRLYKNFNFAAGSLVQFMMSVLFMSSSLLINIFLQQVYQFTPSQVGMLMFPQGMGTGLFSVIRGMAGTLGVTLSSVFLEHQRTTPAIYLVQQQEEPL